MVVPYDRVVQLWYPMLDCIVVVPYDEIVPSLDCVDSLPIPL